MCARHVLAAPVHAQLTPSCTNLAVLLLTDSRLRVTPALTLSPSIDYPQWHLGRASHSSFTGGKQPIAPSAIVINGARFGSDGMHAADGTKQPYEVPRALETAEIPGLVENFRAAAACVRASHPSGFCSPWSS